LGQSIKEHGMLQPIVVRQVGDRYQVIAGERRLRAATAAGLDRVPVQVRDADDRQLAELAIVENLQRKDLNALEKAASFQQYLRQYGCTQDELARRVKIDRSTIANLIRLLELPEAVQQALCSGAITQGHARALLPLGDEREQIAFCLRIQRESLTVRDTEEQVQAMIRRADTEPLSVFSPGRPAARPRTRSEHLMALEQELRTALGCKVDIRQTSLGRGRIVVHFKSHQEFERLRNHLTGQEDTNSRSQVV
jgi:ParB family chromosome partitioning protein